MTADEDQSSLAERQMQGSISLVKMEMLKNYCRCTTIAMMWWIVGACTVLAAEAPIPPNPAAATKESTKEATKVAEPPRPAAPVLALVPSGGAFASNVIVV